MIIDRLKKAADLAIVYSIAAAIIVCALYPAWSESQEYMVEWSFTLITGVTAFVLGKGYELNYSPKLLPVVAILWLYAMGQSARAKAYAQLPCTRWETSTCWVCTEYELTQSGEVCSGSEEAECTECVERTWRAQEWK